MAAQFTPTKEARARGESVWTVRATSSFPVPLSPRTRTGTALVGLLDLLAHRLNGRTPAQQGGALSRPCLASQEGNLATDAGAVHGLLQEQEEPFEIDRLAEVVVGPRLHGLDRRLDASLSCEEDRYGEGGLFLQALNEFKAVHHWHDEVRDDHGRPKPTRRFQCLGAPLAAASTL